MADNKTTLEDIGIVHDNKFDLCNFIKLAETCPGDITSFLVEIQPENGKFKTLNTKEKTINLVVDKKEKLVYFSPESNAELLKFNERARYNIQDSLKNFEYKNYCFKSINNTQ